MSCDVHMIYDVMWCLCTVMMPYMSCDVMWCHVMSCDVMWDQHCYQEIHTYFHSTWNGVCREGKELTTYLTSHHGIRHSDACGGCQSIQTLFGGGIKYSDTCPFRHLKIWHLWMVFLILQYDMVARLLCLNFLQVIQYFQDEEVE